MSKEVVPIRHEDDFHSSGGDHPPVDLSDSVKELFNMTVRRISGRPIEMYINGDWEHPDGQVVDAGEHPSILERRKFDARTGAYIGLGIITVAAALTAVHTIRHIQKKKH